MTLDRAQAALVAAGFAGVEREGDTVFARDGAEAPEFTVQATGAGLRLALRFPVRATEAQRSDWIRAHPAARLEIVAGETELSLVLPDAAAPGDGLALWRDLTRAGARAAVGWRRRERPVHGM